MAYGQTGSGKTYTMLGPQPPGAAQGDAGLIPRAAQELFRYRRPREESACTPGPLLRLRGEAGAAWGEVAASQRCSQNQPR